MKKHTTEVAAPPGASPGALPESVTQTLLAWFAANARPLPWRRSYAPYEVWISEMMLQQTQMERGVQYFLRWMERFPDARAVAEAPESDILHAWEGLGYYRRARFVHAAAKEMAAKHGGRVPGDEAALAALPGLGAYTVAAIRAIAFNQDAAVVDANVERIFSRLLNLDAPPKSGPAARRVRLEAERLLPGGRAREYNQALMDFGALVCAKVPRCEACPLAAHCESRRLGLERQRPVLAARAETVAVSAGYGVLELDGRVLLRQRPEGGRGKGPGQGRRQGRGQGLWGGLWEFPGDEARKGESPVQAAERAFAEMCGLAAKAGEGKGPGDEWPVIRHSYTNHRLSAHFYRMTLQNGAEPPNTLPENFRWADIARLGDFAMPSHHRKLARRLQHHLTETE